MARRREFGTKQTGLAVHLRRRRHGWVTANQGLSFTIFSSKAGYAVLYARDGSWGLVDVSNSTERDGYKLNAFSYYCL
jgi:hypothetical protein